MARRRYISTAISVDRQINRLDDFAALLYTWMIPHVEDNATITADVEELMLIVIPGRRDKTAEDVRKALADMSQNGLLDIDTKNHIVRFPSSFYKFQSYIPEEKRCIWDDYFKKDLSNGEEQREKPQNAVSPSPSPSPSPSKTTCPPDKPADVSEDKKGTDTLGLSVRQFDLFLRFYSAYPRRVKKRRAAKAWQAIKPVPDEALLGQMLDSIRAMKRIPGWDREGMRFVLHPASWLNAGSWEDELPEDVDKQKEMARKERDAQLMAEEEEARKKALTPAETAAKIQEIQESLRGGSRDPAHISS